MYIRDDKTDDVVAKHEQLQKVIRGETAMVVVPGHAAHMLVGMGSVLGWMGTSLAAFGLAGNSRSILPYLLLAGLIVVSILSLLLYQVLRGHPMARGRMFGYACGLAALGVCVLIAALLWGDRSTLVVGGFGMVASALTARCIAGANYALFAAFFRAKRKYADQVRGVGSA